MEAREAPTGSGLTVADLAHLRRVGRGALWLGPFLFILGILPPRDWTGSVGCLVGLHLVVDGHRLKDHPGRPEIRRYLLGAVVFWGSWVALWAWRGIAKGDWGWVTPLCFLVAVPDEWRMFRILRRLEGAPGVEAAPEDPTL